MTIIDRIDCAATRAQLIAMAAVQEGARALRPRTTAEPTEGRDPEEGATTVEYAIGTIAAAAALVGLVYLLVRRNKYDENTLSISAVAAAAK